MRLKIGFELMCEKRALFGYYHNHQELINEIESKAKGIGIIVPINKPRYWVFQSKDQYLELDRLFKDKVLDDQWEFMKESLDETGFDIPAKYYDNIKVLRNQILTPNDIEIWTGWDETIE